MPPTADPPPRTNATVKLAAVVGLLAMSLGLSSYVSSPADALNAARSLFVTRTAVADPGIIDIPSPVNHTGNTEACAGYRLSHIAPSDTGYDGSLEIIGECNAYGPDYPTLVLSVRYETADRLRVRIIDSGGKAHTVPDDVVEGGWPGLFASSVTADKSNLLFEYESDPFSFKVVRKGSGEVLFDTTDSPLIFEEQYLRVGSRLPPNSHIQGLGQHNDNFNLPIHQTDYVRTLWSRDAYGVPERTNLYGTHPGYINQILGGERASSSGVFLLNSNGMDVKFPSDGQNIEFNALGGVVDVFFFNGPTPADVVRQGAEVWKPSAMVPYWSLGFHSCKYGYIDIAEVAEVVANYSLAKIPLQTQWIDIDYMHSRWINTLDTERYGLDKVRYVVDKLHEAGQDFILMVDPAVFSGTPDVSAAKYETLQTGIDADIFLRYANGDLYEGVVWPGPTAFPDWTHKRAQQWWTSEFKRFFDAETGVNVDGIWLDMNEPANFLPYLEANIYRVSIERDVPPPRPEPRIIPRSIPGFEAFQAGRNISEPLEGSKPYDGIFGDKFEGQSTVYPDPNTLDDYLSADLDNKWLYPPYRIHDRRAPPSTTDATSNQHLKNISDFSARTDLVQANGARTYDEHNLYGSRHAIRTRNALIERSPEKRPFTIVRSSFTGTPSSLWLGDNVGSWQQYAQSIRQMLQFSISGVGVVGSDTCGFIGATTETLCARWAWLGAFNTFYRNHNDLGSPPQEFYLWPLTTIAARAAGHTRLSLLDYQYTALHYHSLDGTPVLWPLSWLHPEDTAAINIETQFYFGDAVLVSPVLDDSSAAFVYLPGAVYYDFFTYERVWGGRPLTLHDVPYDTMPLHILGGRVVPLREGLSYTTQENRALPFKLVVAPDSDGTAEGRLYLDDGESLHVGDNKSDIEFTFADGKLEISGSFGYRGEGASTLDTVVFAGQDRDWVVKVDGQEVDSEYDRDAPSITVRGLKREWRATTIEVTKEQKVRQK
ncbi:hypothetical protein Q8F55_003380 [Vanrija albida]|uniref:Probable alpha/beta-glucosidase agdC n=1 Tax=Vanrija albida TaxID=181172 RepID=A0ABR3Q4D4_9TREE